MEKISRILIIKHGALGDLMQSVGVMMDIRAHFKDATIMLLTSPVFQALMERCPYLDQVVADPRAPFWRLDIYWNMSKLFNRLNIDLVIDLQNSSRTRLYRAKWFNHLSWIGRNAEAPVPLSGLEGQIQLMQDAGIPTVYARHVNLEWMIDTVSNVIPEFDHYVVLLPGSSARHPEKRWPHFASLSAELLRRGINVVVILGPAEMEMAESMKGLILNNLSWFALAGVLKRASLVIGNDSGPSHIAAHLGCRGLALFGPATSAARAEIATKFFKTLSVRDLSALSVAMLLDHINQAWGVSVSVLGPRR